MKEIIVNKSKAFTVPATATTLTISHEWGDIVLPETAVTSSYSFTPDSLGIHKFVWRNAGNTIVSTDFYDATLIYLSGADFFTDYPELEIYDDKFVATERRVRRVINSYTQQIFGPYVNKTMILEGQGSDELSLPLRMRNMVSVQDNIGTIFTEIVEISPNTEYFLQRKSDYIGGRFTRQLYWDDDIKREVTRDIYNLFSIRYNYHITGDWGWEYVPQDVSEATSLLVADELSGANELRKHGFTEGQLGDFSYRLAAEYTSTTGNTQADALLSPYVLFNIGLV